MIEKLSSRIKDIPREWGPEASWTISRNDLEVAKFLFPALGANTYEKIVGEVLANKEKGINLPTGEQIAFLLTEVYNSDDPEIRGGRRVDYKGTKWTNFVRHNIMSRGSLCVPVINIFTPKEVKNSGMYAVFDQNGEGEKRMYTNEELEDRLSGGDTEKGVRFSQDRTVSFAPQKTMDARGYRNPKPSEFGACIAVYGSEGSKALDEVSEAFHHCRSYNFPKIKDSINVQSLSTLTGIRDQMVGERIRIRFDAESGRHGRFLIPVSSKP